MTYAHTSIAPDAFSFLPLEVLGHLFGCRVTRCPPALDTQFSDSQILSRVLARDPPPAWHTLVARRVEQRKHARDGWTLPGNDRLERIIEGHTVGQMLAHGVTVDDLWIAQREGWLDLEDVCKDRVP